MPINPGDDTRVALITGGARRIGAAIARNLHAAGCRVLIHCHSSQDEARTLALELNARRSDSCAVLRANLCDMQAVLDVAEQAESHWGRLDLLVNNASGFYATPIGAVSEQQWEDLFGSNVKGAFFLAQALAPALAVRRGAIVNIADVHAELPLRNHAVYSMAKAALATMTRALAQELGPGVRVNGVAPGAILWPDDFAAETSVDVAADLLGTSALQRMGDPADIAGAVRYLGLDAPFVTGQILAVDGGRSLYG